MGWCSRCCVLVGCILFIPCISLCLLRTPCAPPVVALCMLMPTYLPPSPPPPCSCSCPPTYLSLPPHPLHAHTLLPCVSFVLLLSLVDTVFKKQLRVFPTLARPSQQLQTTKDGDSRNTIEASDVRLQHQTGKSEWNGTFKQMSTHTHVDLHSAGLVQKTGRVHKKWSVRTRRDEQWCPGGWGGGRATLHQNGHHPMYLSQGSHIATGAMVYDNSKNTCYESPAH